MDETIRCDFDTITRNAPNLLILEMGPMMCATAAAICKIHRIIASCLSGTIDQRVQNRIYRGLSNH